MSDHERGQIAHYEDNLERQYRQRDSDYNELYQKWQAGNERIAALQARVAVMSDAEEMRTALETENGKLKLDLKCLEESTVDRKAYERLQARVDELERPTHYWSEANDQEWCVEWGDWDAIHDGVWLAPGESTTVEIIAGKYATGTYQLKITNAAKSEDDLDEIEYELLPPAGESDET